MRTLVLLVALSCSAHGADWFAAVDGTPDNQGVKSSPWDLATALSKRSVIEPGDTLYLRGGSYRFPLRDNSEMGFKVSLHGNEDHDITIRPFQNERVTIDGGLISDDHVQRQPGYLTIRDLELLVSENLYWPRNAAAAHPGPLPPRAHGGINLYNGNDLNIINCVVHCNQHGLNLWKGIRGESETYGNIIFNNGWTGTSRGHTHGMYTQNENPAVRRIENNIILGNFAFCVQAYGSSNVPTDNYIFVRNICNGAWHGRNGGDTRTLIGGQAGSTGLQIVDNCLYRSNLQIGFYTGGDGLLCSSNEIIMARLFWGTDGAGAGWTNAIMANNFEWREAFAPGGGYAGELMPQPEGGASIPTEPIVKVHPNKYDENRFHVAILSFHDETTAELDVGDWFEEGEAFILKEPVQFYQGPQYRGTVKNGKAVVPTRGPTSGQLTVYVLFRDVSPSLVSVPLPEGASRLHIGVD